MVDYEITKVYESESERMASVILSDFSGYEIEVDIIYSDKAEVDYVRILEAMSIPSIIEGDVVFARSLSDEILRYGYDIAERASDEVKKNDWQMWAEKKSLFVMSHVQIMEVDLFRIEVARFILDNNVRGALEYAIENGYKLNVIQKILLSVDTETCKGYVLVFAHGNKEPVLELYNNDVGCKDYDPQYYVSDYKIDLKEQVELKIMLCHFDYNENVFFTKRIDIGYSDALINEKKSKVIDVDINQIADSNYIPKWNFPSEPTV